VYFVVLCVPRGKRGGKAVHGEGKEKRCGDKDDGKVCVWRSRLMRLGS